MFWEFPLKIPAYNTSTKSWFEVVFNTKKEMIDYMWKQFKLPGKYNLTLKKNKIIQEAGIEYIRTQKLSGQSNFQGGRYHNFSKGSLQYKSWIKKEKEKILNGIVVDDLYIPPFYYWYINFCPIYDDVKKKTRLGDIWDTDIYYFHYIMLCLLIGRHVYGVKGRQKGFSFKHAGFEYWVYCWFEGAICTIGAFEEELVSKTWRFIEAYRNHVNQYTPWRRGPVRPKALSWMERTENTDGSYTGLNSKLSGVTFKQSPTKDVGGNQTVFNYEEPGVSPTIEETYEFIKPAMVKGNSAVGIFIACGSVGKLEDADGLKNMFYTPENYYGLPIKNVWDDTAGDDETCGIFISEAYSMIGENYHTDSKGNIIEGDGKPFIDEAGNSNVELALSWISRNAELNSSKSKDKELEQIATSQKCTSPKQAFAERKQSYFPIQKLKRRQEQIKILDETNSWTIKPRKGLLFIDKNGDIQLDEKDGGPEHGYPINPAWEDKRGLVTIYKWPTENLKLFINFSGVDTVEADDTRTSNSIQSVDIFETAVQVKDENGKLLRVEGDRLVATYRGRFNPVDGGNEQAWLLIKLYNAYCYQERSKPNFQSYMKRNGYAERYLAKESEVSLFKDVNLYDKKTDSGLYGFTITENNEMWRTLKKVIKEYFLTEYGREVIVDEQGNEKIVKIITGIDLIDDYWLLEEAIQYAEDSKGSPKKNTDRLISFGAALLISKVFQNNNFPIKIERSVKKEEKKQYSIKSFNALDFGTKKQYNKKITKIAI